MANFNAVGHFGLTRFTTISEGQHSVSDMSKPLALLEQTLGHTFADQELLVLALRHRSLGAKNYERLEFLGDSLLGLVIADYLYKNFSEQTEGKLSRMRSSLVRKETLAEIARGLSFGDFLMLGEGEMKSGGYRRESILADTVESVIGALYLDGGLSAARKFILKTFASLLHEITPETSFKDPKSRLQEVMQKRGFSLPNYTIVETSGLQHAQMFTVLCKLNELPVEAKANGDTRRQAEQKSAKMVLAKLQKLEM